MKIQTHDLVVFSHLRWEFVTQRPQHIITRVAKKRNVLFVEEPVDYPTRIFSPRQNITVLQPNAPAIDSLLFRETVLTNSQLLTPNDPILWFYSASFVDMLDIVPHSLIIYDCMDELSLFRGAPLTLINQEKRLLGWADIVFTGGKSLYESKKQFHPNVYCFPSSVDSKHFETAKHPDTTIPEELQQLKKPIVGFVGVIDERIDIELLGKIATTMPNVDFAMIGPVVKINPEDLPSNDNIHYLGQQAYEKLPNFLKGIDIAMMPFALNDATKYISPTKTLEFIAADKPIISTPIYDVVRDYKDVVKIIRDENQFKLAVEDFLTETEYETDEREKAYDTILEKTSWDETVRNMEKIINSNSDKNFEFTIQQLEALALNQSA